jgi:hypothetical protein
LRVAGAKKGGVENLDAALKDALVNVSRETFYR